MKYPVFTQLPEEPEDKYIRIGPCIFKVLCHYKRWYLLLLIENQFKKNKRGKK